MKQFLYLLIASFCVFSCETAQVFIPTVRMEEVLTTNALLNQIYFTSPTTGIVIGEDGIFMTSTDAGETWQQVPEAPAGINYNAISFPTASVGYVSGVGAVLKTTDGGISWELVLEGYYMRYTCFPSENIGYGIDGNYVYKTSDGGETWNDIYAYSVCGIAEARAIYFFDNVNGYLVDESWSDVAMSSSGGNSWTYASEYPSIAYAHTRRYVNGISYWAAGNDTYYSGMYYTTDGDEILRYSNSGFNTKNFLYVNGMHSWNGTNFIAFGPATCALSNDGGKSWTEVFDENGVNFTLDDGAVMENGRYAGIIDSTIYLLTQDCTVCE